MGRGSSNKPVQVSASAQSNSGNATIGTSATWTEIITALGAVCDWLIVSVVSTRNTTGAATASEIKIGTGAAASEVTLIDKLYTSSTTSGGATVATWTIPINIAGGTRVAAQFVDGGNAGSAFVYISALKK